MNHEHHPWQKKGVVGGANADTDRSLHDSLQNSYEDAENMKPLTQDGTNGIMRRMPGESLEHARPPGSDAGYECIGTIEVSGRKITFWAHRDDPATFFPYIQVDATIMVQSENLPYLVDWPLQIDKNEDCAGAEFFPVDYNSVPMVFNLGDIIAKFQGGSQQYFSEFTTAPYEINRNAPLDVVVFAGLSNVGAGGGLPVGRVRYGHRYVTDQGDRTNVSRMTPWIDIPSHLGTSTVNSPFPMVRQRSAQPDIQNRTAYAPFMRFRINNEFNYDAIEIIREEVVDDQGGTGTSSIYMVQRINISPGQFDIGEFTDTVPTEDATQLSEDDLARGLLFIKRAKAVKYHDSRLNYGNIEIEDPNSFSADFLEFPSTEKLVPITKDLGRDGYRDPVNNTYFRRFKSGERYGFALQPFNQIFGKGFAIPIPGYENFQMPNRRNEKAGESLQYSDLPLEAANTDNAVTPTFEAVNTDQNDMRIRVGNPGNLWRMIVASDFVLAEPPNPPYSAGDNIPATFAPLTPTSQDDTDESGLEFNTTVGASLTSSVTTSGTPPQFFDNGSPSTPVAYQPKVHAPKVQSLGVAIAGIENPSDNLKAFSIARTKKAGRVVCQGLGFWHLSSSTTQQPATRLANRLWFQSIDMESGLISEEVRQDILNNPSQYKVQLVSPIGFTCETFSGHGSNAYVGGIPTGTVDSQNTEGVDMLLMARVFKEGPVANALGTLQNNPGGYGTGHVGYSRWRATTTPTNSPFAAGGEVTFDLTAAQEAFGDHLRGGSKISLLLSPPSGQLYALNQINAAHAADIGSVITRQFHEPIYVVNIIKEGVSTDVDGDIQYFDTGYYQKMESVIGYSPGQVQQTHDLVDERFDDITALPWDPDRSDRRRYVWVQEPGQEAVRYLDITWLTGSVLTQVALDISNFGFHTDTRGNQVYGIYQTSQLQDGTWQIQIPPSYAPSQGSVISVRYDSDAPMRVFGGDSIVAETPHCFIDRSWAKNPNGGVVDNAFQLNGLPMPFTYLQKNQRYAITRNGLGGPWERVEQFRRHRVRTLRQLLVVADIESDAPHHLYVEGQDFSSQSYPGINYIMRPSQFWSSDPNDVGASGINSAYATIYPNENVQWQYGGFRYIRNLNFDHTNQGLPPYVKPPPGSTFKSLLCHSIAASLQKNHRATNSPSLRTFIDDDTLIQDLDDAFGEIKFLDAMRSGQGENLYAVTNDGVAIVYTNKSPLYGADGNLIGVQALDSYFNTYQWLSRGIGCPDEFWRMASRGLVPGDGGYIDAWIVPYRRGVSMLTASGMRNISRNAYDSVLVEWMKRARADMTDRMSGVYDSTNNLFMISMGWANPNQPGPGQPTVREDKVFVYSPSTGWIGKATYLFDRYLCSSLGDVYGMRDGEVYVLEQSSNTIGGEPMTSSIDVPFGPNTGGRKEFCRIRSHSVAKPFRVEFYDRDNTLLATMDQATFGDLYLMQMDGWEHHVPSLANGWRMQDDVVMARLIWSNGDDPRLTDVQMQIKQLK